MRYSCGSLCTNGLRLPPRSRASGCHPREHRHSRPGHHSRHARHARHPHHRRPGHPLAHHHAGHHSRNIRRPHHASHHLRHHHHRHSRHHPHGALRAGEHPAHPLAITLAALASLALAQPAVARDPSPPEALPGALSSLLTLLCHLHPNLLAAQLLACHPLYGLVGLVHILKAHKSKAAGLIPVPRDAGERDGAVGFKQATQLILSDLLIQISDVQLHVRVLPGALAVVAVELPQLRRSLSL
mmetsp:Transcript_27615/g.62589  ORF Transcript_27615/g.62589 Transcript_27615/m.62589 type:complete len:242 (-) Transcript_27615:934-1659(-)